MAGFIISPQRDMFSATSCLLIMLTILIGPVCLHRAKAEILIDVATYSFTNSPQLIAPKVFQSDEGVVSMIGDARFVNYCNADSGINASYVDVRDRENGMYRVYILRQRINPEGCPDIFQPVARKVNIVSKTTEPLQAVYLLDHITGPGEEKLTPPPLSFPISYSAEYEGDEREVLRVEASPLAGFTGQVPILSSVRIVALTENQLIRYVVELVASIPGGRSASESFSAWCFETRIGVDELKKTPVTDWFIVLPKKGVHIEASMEPTTFRIKGGGVKGVNRRIGFVNPLSVPAGERKHELFTFFNIH